MAKKDNIGSVSRVAGPDLGRGSAAALSKQTLQPPLVPQHYKLATGMEDPVTPGMGSNVTDNYQATNKVRRKPASTT